MTKQQLSQNRTVSVTITKQTYELLLALATVGKESLSSVGARILENNVLGEVERVERIQKYLSANKAEIQIHYRTTKMKTEQTKIEHERDSLEDGVGYTDNTLIKEALQRWKVLEETEVE